MLPCSTANGLKVAVQPPSALPAILSSPCQLQAGCGPVPRCMTQATLWMSRVSLPVDVGKEDQVLCW